MGFLIGLLTVIMVLDCVVLVFLVLIQLPKKDAGAGLAFGAGATDALFGAGSGTVLTKITRHAATIFFVMAIVLSLLQRWYNGRNASEFEKQLSQTGSPLATSVTPPVRPGSASTPTAPGTNLFQVHTQGAEATNLPAAPINLPSAPTNPAPAGAPQK
jgi:preprotein translocase subunit SecG